MDWTSATDKVIKTCMQTFGAIVEYHPTDARPYILKGIFTSSYQEVQPDGQVVQSTQPVLGINSADLKREPQPGDKIIYRNKFYRVVAYHPDGDGGTEIYLHQI